MALSYYFVVKEIHPSTEQGGGETMPRLLYCARTRPPLEPPFPSAAAGQEKTAAAHQDNALQPRFLIPTTKCKPKFLHL
jgi:hypothetical protein